MIDFNCIVFMPIQHDFSNVAVGKGEITNQFSSTNIDQSAPILVKMYVIIRSQMSLIMDLIGPELSELSALELENLPHLTLFTL